MTERTAEDNFAKKNTEVKKCYYKFQKKLFGRLIETHPKASNSYAITIMKH